VAKQGINHSIEMVNARLNALFDESRVALTNDKKPAAEKWWGFLVLGCSMAPSVMVTSSATDPMALAPGREAIHSFKGGLTHSAMRPPYRLTLAIENDILIGAQQHPAKYVMVLV
jgi:hypothetical protein